MTTKAGCFGKIGYGTRAEAQAVSKRMRAKANKRAGERGKPEPYHCPKCGRLHIGKDRTKGRVDRVKAPGWWAAKAQRWRELTGGGQ